MASDYTLVILITFFGFCLLAFILLWPVYKFLKREEEVSKRWSPNDAMPRSLPNQSRRATRSTPAAHESPPSPAAREAEDE